MKISLPETVSVLVAERIATDLADDIMLGDAWAALSADSRDIRRRLYAMIVARTIREVEAELCREARNEILYS